MFTQHTNLISHYNFVNIKVGSLNCRGLNNHLKRHAIFKKLKDSDLTFICLQETKLSPEEEFCYKTEWEKGPCFFNSIKGSKSGTAILFNTKQIAIKKSIMDHKILHPLGHLVHSGRVVIWGIFGYRLRMADNF